MIVALDTGGTNIRAALVEGHDIIDIKSTPCPYDGDTDTVNSCIIALISEVITPDVEAIGAGVPAVVDTASGTLYNAVNIPAWQEVCLKNILESRFGVPVRVDNDCNCFALGEYTYGAGLGCRDMVGITLGTGVGAGLILGGHLYGGVMSGAGEIGSLPFRDSDYEHYCSSMYFRDFHATNGQELSVRAAAGDREALAVWREFGRNLGHLVTAILFAYAPQRIVIGGGIAASMPLFESGMQEIIDAFPYQPIAKRCDVKRASLEGANLIGAAELARR